MKRGFLGIDVSKGASNFVLQDELDNVLEKNFKLYDCLEGHQKLTKFIRKFRREHQFDELVIGLESTGGYENNWYCLLRRLSSETSGNLKVKRLNPRPVSYEGKTEGRQSTDDGISSQVIACYLRKNYHHLDFSDWEQSERIESARKFCRYSRRLVKNNTQTKNALEKDLYSNMPEIMALKGEKYPNWYLTLLTQYPSRRLILEAGAGKLSEISYLSKKRAEEIVEAMRDSVGKPGDHYSEAIIREQAEDIHRVEKKLKRVRKDLEKLMRSISERKMEIVESIGGLGTDTAVQLILEMGDVSRFAKAKNLIAFWGINPVVKISGDKKAKIGMSKCGSPAARAALYMAAKNVRIHEPYFVEMYKRHRAKGNSEKQALCKIMSKLARVLYGMLKNNTTFDRKVDENNKAKKPSENQEVKKVKNEERYQSEPGLAPISRIQRSRRRKEKAAQKEKEQKKGESGTDANGTEKDQNAGKTKVQKKKDSRRMSQLGT